MNSPWRKDKKMKYQHTTVVDFLWIQYKFLCGCLIFGALRNQNFTGSQRVSKNLGTRVQLKNIKYGKQLLSDGHIRPTVDITAKSSAARILA